MQQQDSLRGVPPPPNRPPSRSSSGNNLKGPSSVPITAQPFVASPSLSVGRVPSVLTKPDGGAQLVAQPVVPQNRFQGAQSPSQSVRPESSSNYRAINSNEEPTIVGVHTTYQQPQNQQQQQQQQQLQSNAVNPTWNANSNNNGASDSQQSSASNRFVSAPPLPDVAIQRLKSGIDRESLRPSASAGYRPSPVQATPAPAGPGFSTGSNVQTIAFSGSSNNAADTSSRYYALRAVSPRKDDFRRPTSPTVNWMSNNVPRFHYEPPPMIPSYFDVDRIATTPKRAQRGGDRSNSEMESLRDYRVPAEERWGPPVRVVPDRFNSVPEFSNEDEAEQPQYTRRPAPTREEVRRHTQHQGKHRDPAVVDDDRLGYSHRQHRQRYAGYGAIENDYDSNMVVERQRDEDRAVSTSRKQKSTTSSKRPVAEGIVFTPRDDSSRRQQDESASRSRRSARHGGGDGIEESDDYQLRQHRSSNRHPVDEYTAYEEERRHRSSRHDAKVRDVTSPDRGESVVRASKRHETPTPRSHHRHHHRQHESDRDYSENDRRHAISNTERERKPSRRVYEEEALSPDSYVVGRPHDYSSVSTTTSRRRPDESEEDYRARRRAEREQRRMMAR